MAIKMRRGAYKDFNPDMMVPGEIAVVLSGDPAVPDGRTFYICFEPGKVKRLMTKEDLQNEINKVTADIVEQVTIVADKAEAAADRLDAAQDVLDALAQSTSTAGTAKEQLDTAIAIAEGTLQDLEPIQEQIDTVKDDITAINADIEQMQTGKADKSDLVNVIYPVGAIYISVSSTNPSTFLGGTWERFARGQTLIGVDASDTDFNAAGKTGGSKTHKLIVAEMPKHTIKQNPHGHDIKVGIPAYGNIQTISPYSNAPGGEKEYYIKLDGITDATNQKMTAGSVTATNLPIGGDQPHNNMPPYITVYMWRRTA